MEGDKKEDFYSQEDNCESTKTGMTVKDASSAIRYLLQLSPVESVAQELEDFGVPKHEQTNMIALQARLYGKAMGGDLKSYEVLMKMGGYEALSGRTSEQEERITISGANGPEDVFIYLPKIDDVDQKSGNNGSISDPGGGSNAKGY